MIKEEKQFSKEELAKLKVAYCGILFNALGMLLTVALCMASTDIVVDFGSTVMSKYNLLDYIILVISTIEIGIALLLSKKETMLKYVIHYIIMITLTLLVATVAMK